MKYFGDGLSGKHKELNRIIRKESEIDQSKILFLEIHDALNMSEVSGTEPNEVDKLLTDLSDSEYAIMPSSDDETIAWALWHIARIEDITVNMLVAGEEQLFDDERKKRMNVSVTDTGNAMTDDEIMLLSKSVNVSELIKYRNDVARKTRQVVSALQPRDMKRRISDKNLERVLLSGGVTKDDESIWLLDFWGKKDIAGILLMPPTRHVIMHLNNCCKWKEIIRTKKRFFRS